MAIAKLRHLAAALADSADVYHRLNYCHLTRIEDHILRRILGVALILISIYFMLFSTRIKLPARTCSLARARTTKKVQVGAGALSGLMGGFFGMQGPPAVLYFIQSEPTKEHYMAKSIQRLFYHHCSS